jgi:hypothetical protein
MYVTKLLPKGILTGALLTNEINPTQLSVAVGFGKLVLGAVQVVPADKTVGFAGQVMLGGVKSRTFTVIWQVAVLPFASVAM